MNTRRGLGKGLGTGYKNLVPIDTHIHSLSAKGVKTYNYKTPRGQVSVAVSSPNEITTAMKYNTKSVSGTPLLSEIKSLALTFDMNDYAKAYFNEFDSSYVLYGNHGLQTQIAYFLSNVKAKTPAQKQAKERLLSIMKDKTLSAMKRNKYGLPIPPKGADKIHKAELNWIPKDWDLLHEYWTDTDAHILIGKSNGKYMIIRTFMIGNRAGTSVDYQNLSDDALASILTQRKYTNTLTAKGKKSEKEFKRLAKSIWGDFSDFPDEPKKLDAKGDTYKVWQIVRGVEPEDKAYNEIKGLKEPDNFNLSKGYIETDYLFKDLKSAKKFNKKFIKDMTKTKTWKVADLTVGGIQHLENGEWVDLEESE